MKQSKSFEISEIITTRPDTGILVSTLLLEDRRYLKSCLINKLPANFELEKSRGGDFQRDQNLGIGICYNKQDLSL